MFFFFFNDTATTEIYPLSLHDALPIYYFRGFLSRTRRGLCARNGAYGGAGKAADRRRHTRTSPDLSAGEPLLMLHQDRKSTRLNSSHANISHAVFCLKNNITGGLNVAS